MNNTNLSSMQNSIVPLSQLDKCVHLLDDIIKYQDSGLPTSLNQLYPDFCNYALFLEGVQYPFFYKFRHIIGTNIVKLFSFLSKKTNEFKYRLTSDEAFYFLCAFGKEFGIDNVREIFDTINLSSSIYSSAINALENCKKEEFCKALNSIDCTDFMKTLWFFRFVVYGVTSISKDWKGNLDYYNMWFHDTTYGFIFNKDIRGTYDNDFIESKINDFIYCKSKRNDLTSYIISHINIDEKDYYAKFNAELWKKMFEDKFKDYNKLIKFVYDNSKVTSEALESMCREYGEGFIISALYSHKDILSSRLGNDFIKELEIIKAKYPINDAAGLMFAYYVVLYLGKISIIYSLAKDVISSDENEILSRILNRFFDLGALTNNIIECISHNVKQPIVVTTKIDSSTTNKTLVTNPNKKRLGYCINISKRYSEIRNDEMYTQTLRYLYQYLSGTFYEMNENEREADLVLTLNTIQFIDCPEADFIYIFGGIVNEDDVSKEPIIKWIYNDKNEMAAFFIACCSENKETNGADLNPGLFTRKKCKQCCYSFNGESIYLFSNKDDAIKHYDRWAKIITECGKLAKRKIESRR